jgi:alpha-methylacyl-CoA racemase
VADLAGGAWPAAMQICAALVGRARTGDGAIIDVDMTAGVTGLLAMVLARVAVSERIDGGRDLLVGRVPCYDIYPTADGHLAIGALEPKFWEAVCRALHRPDLADRGFDDDDSPQGARAIVRAILQTKTTAAWMEQFSVVDCCVEPILAPEQVYAGCRGVMVAVEGQAPLKLPTLGLGLVGHTPSSSPAPALGRDTERLLAIRGHGLNDQR